MAQKLLQTLLMNADVIMIFHSILYVVSPTIQCTDAWTLPNDVLHALSSLMARNRGPQQCKDGLDDRNLRGCQILSGKMNEMNFGAATAERVQAVSNSINSLLCVQHQNHP